MPLQVWTFVQGNGNGHVGVTLCKPTPGDQFQSGTKNGILSPNVEVSFGFVGVFLETTSMCNQKTMRCYESQTPGLLLYYSSIRAI